MVNSFGDHLKSHVKGEIFWIFMQPFSCNHMLISHVNQNFVKVYFQRPSKKCHFPSLLKSLTGHKSKDPIFSTPAAQKLKKVHFKIQQPSSPLEFLRHELSTPFPLLIPSPAMEPGKCRFLRHLYRLRRRRLVGNWSRSRINLDNQLF